MMGKFLNAIQFSKTARRAVVLAFLAIAIFAIFAAPPSIEFTRQYYEFGLERIVFLLILFTLIIRIDGFEGKAITLTFTLLLFFFSLIYKWQSADNFSTMGGLFPVRDAYDYYRGSQMLIHGAGFSGSSTFRPLFTAFLASIMWVVNSNLQIVLIILVFLNAISIFLTTLEINRVLRNGFFSALFLILGYMYYRRFTGTLLTENLGFLLGNLALYFLLRSAAAQNRRYFFWGLFLLTIGLNARAGAFFILPALALWAALSFRTTDKVWQTFFISVMVIIVGFAGNWLLAKAIHSPTSVMFSNYSYTLYGLAAGNKGWEQVLIDHPGTNPNDIYTLAFNKIKGNPHLFFEGIRGAYLDYFAASKGAFSFLQLKRDRNDSLNIALWILSLASLVISIVMRKQKSYSISLAFFSGIMLSVGLVPPADSTMMRAYAATIPMSLYIIVIVGGFLSEKFSLKQPPKIIADNNTGLNIPIVLSGIILVAGFLLPVIIQRLGSLPTMDNDISCGPGKRKSVFLIAGGSSMIINGEAKKSYIPDIEYARFTSKLLSPDQLMDGAAVELLNIMKPGKVLTISPLAITSSNEASPSYGSILVTDGIPQAGVQIVCVESLDAGIFYILSDGTYETHSISTPATRVAHPIKLFLKFWVIVVFLYILIKSARVLEFPVRIIPLVFVNTLFMAAGVLLLFHISGLMPLAWQQWVLQSDQFRNPENFMYAYNLGDSDLSDTKFWDYPAFLYENDQVLFQPHESQSLISEYGRGRYILREKILFFSTTDNTDPGINGRLYTLKFPSDVRIRYQIIVLTASLVGFLIHLLYFLPKLRTETKEIF